VELFFEILLVVMSLFIVWLGGYVVYRLYSGQD